MAAAPNRHRSATVPTGRRSRASRVIPRRSTTSPATDRRSRASRVVPRCRSTWSSPDLGSEETRPITIPQIYLPGARDIAANLGTGYRCATRSPTMAGRRADILEQIQPTREAPATPLEPHDAAPEHRPPRMRPPMRPPERTSPTDRPAVTDADFAPEPQPPQLHPPARRRRRTRPSPTDRPAVTDADFPRQGR